MLRAGTERLREFGIEEYAADAGDVAEDAVEHLPAALVLVEAQLYEVAQEPTALRDPEADRCLDLAAGGIGGAGGILALDFRNATTSRWAAKPMPLTQGDRAR